MTSSRQPPRPRRPRGPQVPPADHGPVYPDDDAYAYGGAGEEESAPPPSPTAARFAHTEGRNLLRLYGNVTKTLEQRYGAEALGAYLLGLRTGALKAPVESVSQNGAILRVLIRLGIVTPGPDRAAQGKGAEQFVREMAAVVSRTTAEVTTQWRLFAEGLPGVARPAVCGAAPQCPHCGITKDCDYFNAPARPVHDPVSPQRRLARDGASALTDEELIAVLLGSGKAGDKELALVRDLMTRYGMLRALFSAGYGELSSLRVLTESMAARVSAVGELHMRLIHERRYFGPTVRCGGDFFELYHPKLRELKKEVFWLVMLDQRGRVLKDVQLSEGTLTYTPVHPREVFRPAVREAAAAVALVHNHPSGDCTPSAEDIVITQQLAESASVLEIPLVDHIVIGENDYTSMAEIGILDTVPTYQGSDGHPMP